MESINETLINQLSNLSKAGKNRNNKCWNQYLTVLNQKHEEINNYDII